MTTRLLLCIYTCERDRRFLDELKATRLFEAVTQDPRYRVLEVYADAAQASPQIRGDVLVVNCPEAYTSLSMKTFLMLKFCNGLEFDFLLKLDSTIARYTEKRHIKTPEVLAQLTPAGVSAALSRADFFASEYNGLVRQQATEEGVEQWMRTKRLACDYRRVFPDGQSPPPYYLGKFYSLSQSFCRYIATHGHDVAIEHQRYLGGSEDLMIGRLYDRYRQGESLGKEAE